MARAVELARYGMRHKHGGPFGAVIVQDTTIIGEGFNRVLSLKDPTAHAEIVAIREACRALDSFQLSGCDLYTTCEPCPMCLGAIYWARPARVFFAGSRRDAAAAGFDDHFIYEELELPPGRRTFPMQQLSCEDVKGLFEEWLIREDKTVY